MEEIKVKNITLMDQVETKEAQRIYNYKKQKLNLLLIIPILCFFLSLIFTVIQSNNVIRDGYQSINKNPELFTFLQLMTITSAMITIICIFIYRECIRPYKELLEVAKLNDRTRHEEKIRFRERKRLESENKTQYTKEELKETISETKKLG